MIKFIKCMLVGLVFLILSPMLVSAESTDDSIQVILELNHYEIVYAFNSPIFMQDNRVMVPLKLIEEIIGADVTENDDIISIYFSGKQVRLNKKMNVVNIDGMNSRLDTRIIVSENNHTYIPLRVLIDSFDFKTEWNNEYKQVTIDDERLLKTSKMDFIQEIDWDGQPDNVENPNAFQILSFTVGTRNLVEEVEHLIKIKYRNVTGEKIDEGKTDLIYWILSDGQTTTKSGGARTIYEARPEVDVNQIINKEISVTRPTDNQYKEIDYIILWPRTSKFPKSQNKF